MHYNDVAIIILAAGKGTRMASDLAKVLHKVAGKSMVVHVVACALKLTTENIHVVVGHQADKVKDEVCRYFKVNFSIQEQLLGTGDAVKSALPNLKSSIKDVLVLCGDVPLIQEKTLRDLISYHKKNQSEISVLATDLDEPKGYGRIILDNRDQLICIREEADASANEKKINKINAGIYCFDKDLLVSAINEIKPDNSQSEYYLTDVIEIAQKRQNKITVRTMEDPRQVIGVNTPQQLDKAEALIHELTG